jgi:nucleotide-binding universal stress UspA family protein
MNASWNGTIICAVDETDGVDAAVEVAGELAERFGARILLVSVADGYGFGLGIEGGGSVSERQARARARRRLDRLVAEHELPDEEHRIAVGDPVESVALIAAEEAADVIVVGARRGLLGRTLRSSLAAELAATAPCPVVVAPPEAAAGTAARASHAHLRT